MLMPEKSSIANAFNQQAGDFLKIELETGLTFAKIALSGEAGSEKRTRNRANALKAYQTVLRLRKRVPSMNQESTRDIQEGLDQLRAALEGLAEDRDSVR